MKIDPKQEKSELWASHGMKNHPMSEYCEDCERVKKEFKADIKKAGGKKKFLEQLLKETR